MDKILYNDGYTLPGTLGHFFVLLTFITAITATYSYYKYATVPLFQDQLQWKKLARMAFYIQFFSIISIVICLYYILYNHQFQYKFAYKHSDISLPVKYLFSCFWEGQEGSFLLWMFWHSVLGLFVLHSAKQWEAPVMAVVNFVQVFLAAFLIGIYFGDFHIGSSPFVLLRNSDLGIGPIFSRPDYLSFIKDGNGLNKTLQDPWMVIHPPTLFFGYASCTIPMAFAVAALWKKDYKGWVKPSLPWTVLAASVLGVGILMGAKWAYQSLSFGGYWAWDPVENASLVPWLILIAGMHTKLIYKHTGHSLRATFLFIILTFVFIIYSTCLTRTGILGETSVHAFTGGGLKEQIWLLLPFVCIPPLYLLITNYKAIPTIIKEEATWSREFWMFIGALVFFLSGMFVIIATSLPVANKLLGTHAALGENAQMIYNKVHVPIVIVIAIIIAFTQFLKYKNTDFKTFGKKLLLPLLVSIGITIAFVLTSGIQYTKQGHIFAWIIGVALGASIFTVIANGTYLVTVVRKKLLNWGSSLAHLGFGMLLVGILISASNQKIVSMNVPAVNVFGGESKEDPKENLVLFKNTPTVMDQYKVNFTNDYADPISKDKLRYTVDFTDTAHNQKFTLEPTAFITTQNGKKQIQPNPDFKSYWNRDFFLYITSLTNPDEKNKPIAFENKTMAIGDTVALRNGFFILKNSIPIKNTKEESSFKAEIEVYTSFSTKKTIYPSFTFKNNQVYNPTDSIENVQFKIDGVADNNKLNISVLDKGKISDYIAIKVLEFPQIKLLWIGIIIMSIGFMLSMIKRIQLAQK